MQFSSFAVKMASKMVELTDDELRLKLAHQTETAYMFNTTDRINVHSALEAAKEVCLCMSVFSPTKSFVCSTSST